MFSKITITLEVGQEVLVFTSRLQKKNINLENFTKVLLIANLTLVKKSHFLSQTDKKLMKNIFVS